VLNVVGAVVDDDQLTVGVVLLAKVFESERQKGSAVVGGEDAGHHGASDRPAHPALPDDGRGEQRPILRHFTGGMLNPQRRSQWGFQSHRPVYIIEKGVTTPNFSGKWITARRNGHEKAAFSRRTGPSIRENRGGLWWNAVPDEVENGSGVAKSLRVLQEQEFGRLFYKTVGTFVEMLLKIARGVVSNTAPRNPALAGRVSVRRVGRSAAANRQTEFCYHPICLKPTATIDHPPTDEENRNGGSEGPP